MDQAANPKKLLETFLSYFQRRRLMVRIVQVRHMKKSYSSGLNNKDFTMPNG